MLIARMSQTAVIVVAMVLGPIAGIANAQTAPTTGCAIAVGPLTDDQQSMVNDYEVQVARANSHHTPVPLMPDTVFALIGCISPESQTGVAPATSSSTPTTSTATSATQTSPTASSSSGASTFQCPTAGLSKDQESMINDFEIQVAFANSHHTPVPSASPDVAALIACS